MNKLYEENDIQAIADAIRGKNGTQNTYLVAEMANAISSLPAGSDGITPSGTKTINSNGQHDVTSYATAEVNVPVGVFPEGTKQITSNGEVDVTTFEKVNVNVTTSGGGGGITLPSNTVMGEWTPSENIYDTNPVVLQHSLGTTPKYIVMMMEDISDISVVAMLVVNSYLTQTTVTKAGGSIGYTSGSYITELTDSSFKVVGKSNTPFLANKKYLWFAFG